MRGKGLFWCSQRLELGITPAYAGKSKKSGMDSIISQDHPRLCGEKNNLVSSRHHSKGSPPPMRGKVYALENVMDPLRITPAYAGKSCEWAEFATTEEDHPRLCGEKCHLKRRSAA